MKKSIKLILAALVLVMVQSCGVSKDYTTLKPYEAPHYSQMTELEACGEVTVDVEFTSYLWGLFHNIKTVNGQAYNGQNPQSVSMPKGLTGMLGKSAYKVIETYPDAVYFQVVRVEKEKDKLFLGSYNRQKAVVRAYRFRQPKRK